MFQYGTLYDSIMIEDGPSLGGYLYRDRNGKATPSRRAASSREVRGNAINTIALGKP